MCSSDLARSFGGQDYTGYHTLMALLPAWQLSQELPTEQQALPVLKVLYRNTARIQQTGQTGNKETLRPVQSSEIPQAAARGPMLQTLMRKADMAGTEAAFAGMLTSSNPYDAYNDLQHIVQEQPNVHRVVLAWRSWDILQLTGADRASPGDIGLATYPEVAIRLITVMMLSHPCSSKRVSSAVFWLWHPPHIDRNTVFIRRSSGVSSGNAATHRSPGSCASNCSIDCMMKSCRWTAPEGRRSARPAP